MREPLARAGIGGRPARGLALSLLLVPVCVITTGAASMKSCSGYAEVERQLAASGHSQNGRALYARVGGYSTDEVAAHWRLLNRAGRAIERRFERADLVYPLCYGGMLAAAILVGRRRARLSVTPRVAIAPVAIAVMADWTENLVQLRQFDLFERAGASALDSGWISLASAATSLKWISLGTCLVLLVWVAWRVAGEGGDGGGKVTSD